MTESQLKQQHAIDALEAAATVYARGGTFSQESLCRVAVRMIHMGKLNQAYQTVTAINKGCDQKCQDGSKVFAHVETAQLCLKSLINQRSVA